MADKPKAKPKPAASEPKPEPKVREVVTPNGTVERIDADGNVIRD
jgi:hypothetical protein